MKHKLSGLDRINIPIILNKAFPEGTGLEVITMKEILDLIVIKSEEFEEFDLKEDRENKKLNWDVEKIKIEKEFDLKKPHTELLKQAAEKLDKDKKVNLQIVDTWSKIKKMR